MQRNYIKWCQRIKIKMKYLPVIFICLSAILGCRKSNDSSRENNGTRLTSISSDSAGMFNFSYSDNVISGMKFRFSGNNISTSTIEYTNTDSGQLVSVGSFGNLSQYSIHYLLTASKLPLRIFHTHTENGISNQSDLAKFIYQPQADLLDSVITKSPYDTVEKIVYKFNYEGGNIKQITASQISATKNLQIATFDYTYETKPNIFRHSDSLLYIFSYPHSVFHAQPMVIAAFFAETFSASTFNCVTTSGITSNGWIESSLKSKMIYHLNSHGKVTAETFSSNVFEGGAGKEYLYE